MTRYRVVPYDHRTFFVQKRIFLLWIYFRWRFDGKNKEFLSKKEAEDFILSAIEGERWEKQRKKDLKEFKRLNPPYDFP